MTQAVSLTSAQGAVQWLRERVTGTLQTDSRLVAPGDGFIAWPGAATDGRAHVGEALARGATACLVEQEGIELYGFVIPQVAALRGLKAALGLIAAEWFGLPTHRLDVLAVTGTNGKTSTAWWLADALNVLAREGLAAPGGCAVVGTLGVGVPPALEATGMTTPDPVRLQRVFQRFADAGQTACAIEASSIGLAEHRLAGTRVRVALFTNFTQDHLDYHPTMAAYWQAKAMLFDAPGLQSAVVNIDDPRGAELHATLAARPLDVWSVSLREPARMACRNRVATRVPRVPTPRNPRMKPSTPPRPDGRGPRGSPRRASYSMRGVCGSVSNGCMRANGHNERQTCSRRKPALPQVAAA